MQNATSTKIKDTSGCHYPYYLSAQKLLVMFVPALITLLVLCASTIDGRATKDEVGPSRRKLGYYEYTCEDYVDLNDRCCGEDLSECKCPIREWFIFQGIWDHKCEMIASYVKECTADEEETLPNIVESAIALGSFTTLVAAVTAAELDGTLASSDAEFTVFAPTDDAFASLPEGLVECLLKDENKEVLTSILLYHVVDGAAASSGLSDGQEIETLNGESVTVDITDGVVKIDDSVVSQPDFMTSNGIIHVLDSVLVPPGVNVTAFLEFC